jgi:putative membrane protein
LLSLGLILVFHPATYDLKTLIAFTAVAITGFLVEVAGVSTQIVFGSYGYGESLGIKLFDTPLLIGINWLILTYAGSTFASLLGIRGFAAVPAGAALMVIYDLLLEQTAPLLDMWHWQGEKVPLQNYLAWFVLSFLFQWLFRICGVDTRNAVVPVLITAQVLFFFSLLVAFS